MWLTWEHAVNRYGDGYLPWINNSNHMFAYVTFHSELMCKYVYVVYELPQVGVDAVCC